MQVVEPKTDRVPAEPTPTKSPWPAITVILLTVGYAGYYLCRSHFSVAKPLILDEFKTSGITKETLGSVAAVGTACYAAGKFLFGSAADVLGGRRMFLLGMAGAVIFSLLFGFGGPPLFMLAWAGNRAIQASGWVGMIKLTSRWFGRNVYGRVMGFISLSYLFGDFVSRLFLSDLIAHGVGWRGVFAISAAVLAVIFVPTALLLRERPSDRNLMGPESEVAQADAPSGRPRLSSLLRPLLSNPTFLVVCVLSFGFTFMRETFNDWTPTYLHEAAGLTTEAAGRASSLFPLFGGLSVLAVGFLHDRLGKVGAARMISIGLALGAIGLAYLAYGNASSQPAITVGLVAVIGFALIGPYSLLAGAISLDFGGTKSSATAAGWIDGIGYVGGILSGQLIGSVAEHRGWGPAFGILAVTALVSCAVALLYLYRERYALKLAQ